MQATLTLQITTRQQSIVSPWKSFIPSWSQAMTPQITCLGNDFDSKGSGYEPVNRNYIDTYLFYSGTSEIS